MTGATFRRNAGSKQPDRDLLIDRYLPTYDVTQLRHAVVNATPDEAYDAVREVNLVRIGAGPRLLGELRSLPARISARVRGTDPPETPESVTFDELAEETGYVVLAEAPGEEFVLGAVGKFWKPDIEWRDIDAEEFESFSRPGYAKLAVGVSVRPYGTDRTLVTYEARTAATDESSRRRFRRYWALIGPFAGYLMGKVLDTVEADLEGTTIEVE